MYSYDVLKPAPTGVKTAGNYWHHPSTGLPFIPDSGPTGSYMDQLRRKYGRVRIAAVSHEIDALLEAGQSMEGADVIVAPLIYERMSQDPSVAAYFECKISEFFDATEDLEAGHEQIGLSYRPCGVVIHSDGTVTYVCGDTSIERTSPQAASPKSYFFEQRMDVLADQSMLLETTCLLPTLEELSGAAEELEELLSV